MDRALVPPLGPTLGWDAISGDVPLIGGPLSGQTAAQSQAGDFATRMEQGDLGGLYRMVSASTQQTMSSAEFADQISSQLASVGRITEIRNIQPMHVQGDLAWIEQQVRTTKDGIDSTSRHRAVFVWENGSWKFVFSEPLE